MALDTRDQVLGTLVAQGAPAAVIGTVRSLLAAEDEIDSARYLPQRAAELKRERRVAAVGEIVTELTRLEKEIATSAEAADVAQRVAEHERVVSTNGHAVDPHRFTLATTPAEIVLLLRDAEAADPDTLRRSWAYAEPKLRAMAATEQRTHRQPGATSAFNALVMWQTRMRSISAAAPDRSLLADVVASRRRAVRQQALAVARVVGLDAAVEIALKRSAASRSSVGEEPAGNITFGKFFDQFPQSRR
jgi:hypothetical protein